MFTVGCASSKKVTENKEAVKNQQQAEVAKEKEKVDAVKATDLATIELKCENRKRDQEEGRSQLLAAIDAFC